MPLKSRRHRVAVIKMTLVLLFWATCGMTADTIEKPLEDYNVHEQEYVFYTLTFLTLCEEYQPGFRNHNYQKIIDWKEKKVTLVEAISKTKKFKITINNIYTKPNSNPTGEELEERCNRAVLNIESESY